MKYVALLVTAVLCSQALCEEGTEFPADRLNAEERGYLQIFGPSILSITTACYRCYSDWSEAEKYWTLDDPTSAEPWSDGAVSEGQKARQAAKELISNLESYIPPSHFSEVHEELYNFAKSVDQGVRENASSCLALYKKCNHLKNELYDYPVIATLPSTPSSPLNIVFTPFFGHFSYNLTKGTFSISTSIPTPIGTLSFSQQLGGGSSPTTTSPLLMKFHYRDRIRAFYLDRSVRVYTGKGMNLAHTDFSLPTQSLDLYFEPSPDSSASDSSTPASQMPKAPNRKPLKGVEVFEEDEFIPSGRR